MPPGLASRLLAATIIADIAGTGRSLEDALTGEVVAAKMEAFDERDRMLVRSIVIVSLRHLGSLRKTIGRLLERGLPKRSGPLEWILVITAAQILHMDVPDHAAVNLCVQAVRLDPKSQPFAALANALARGLARQKDQPAVDTPVEADPFVNAPVWLAARWRNTYGEATAAAIVAAHAREPHLDITVKSDPAGWAERLGGLVLPSGSIRLRDATPVASLPGYDEGAWWVQDVAAALPARLLGVHPGQRVADLCAAPGGKTAQLAAAGWRVTAVDRSAERLKRLTANLQRLDLEADTQVADAISFSAPPFDAILLDAPCSSTGTIRRHPDVAWTKRGSDIAALTALQARMLDRAFSLLKGGGTLVYCVCSLEPEEGEAQIAGLLRRNPDLVRKPVSADEIGGLDVAITPEGDVRTLPSMTLGPDPLAAGLDGFFAARLMRRDGNPG